MREPLPTSCRLCYIISAYRLPEQAVRLVRRLNSPNATFMIHVDRKTPDAAYAQARDGLARFDNVLFLERHACYWGDFGHVLATIKGIRELVARNIPYDYLVLLTGQDYPIKPNRHIEQLLSASSGNSYMSYFPLPAPGWPGNGGMDRIVHWHFRIGDRFFAFPERRRFKRASASLAWFILIRLFPIERRLPKPFVPYGGSSYWCLSQQCVTYIHQFMEDNRRFVRFFEHVYVPDEIFFQTILLNSALRTQIIRDSLRYIDWTRPERGLPAILRKDDFPALERSPKLFARKFDITIDGDILDMIDEGILGAGP